MNKLRMGLLGLAAGVVVVPGFVSANILGPQPAACQAGDKPAVLVKISGLKSRVGTVRVRSFTGSPTTYFDKRHALQRLEYPMPIAGPVEVCVPLPAPGVYAFDVRHDANKSGKTDRSDGGGVSGNPNVSLFDVIFKRKPPAKQVQVAVGKGTTIVPISIKYL